jgi:hypothetical protein
VRLVVADTGPLVHLSEIDAFDLLRSLGEIHVPESGARGLRYLRALVLEPTRLGTRDSARSLS